MAGHEVSCEADSLQSSQQFSGIFNAALCWSKVERLDPAPPTAVVSALLDSDSLTEQLVARAGSSFQVQRLEEEWCVLPELSLRREFGPIQESHRFWSRKVLLSGLGQPWVLAHTIMPEHSCCSELQQVLQLGDQPLGRYLFTKPELIRANLQFTAAENGMWGRRSVFYLFSKPIMVAEFFTPHYVQQLLSE